MKSLFVLILLGSLLVQVFSRPPLEDYNNNNDKEEAEEDDNDQAAEDIMSEEEDSELNDQDSAVQEDNVPESRRLMDLTESKYLHRNAIDNRPNSVNADNFQDSKYSRTLNAREENQQPNYLDEQVRVLSKRRQNSKYALSDEEEPELQQQEKIRSLNQDANLVANQVDPRTVTGHSNDGDMIFEKNKNDVSGVEINEYNNNDASDASEQSHYFKQYYNNMHSENREMIDDKKHDDAQYNFRDRRDTKDSAHGEESTSASNNQKTKETEEHKSNEDDESAIKAHIKKLSTSELNDLLRSLSVDKRDLLKKIISDVEVRDNGLDKREITKKAQAVEENNIVENSQSDLTKLQGVNVNPSVDDSTDLNSSLNTASTEVQKIDSSTESNGLSSTTSDSNLNSLNKVDLTNTNDQSVQARSDTLIDPKSQNQLADNVQITSKVENKRQANLDDFQDAEFDNSRALENDINIQSNQDYSNDQGYYLQDESSNNDAEVNEENKAHKREAYEADDSEPSDTFKSLEESFPNSDDCDKTASYSAPLVRVKRRNSNQLIKKRSPGLVSDAKVAYVPYKAENEDEDNDEGNEFDDEGFFDRTSNFANSNKGDDETAESDNTGLAKNLKLSNDNFESDTMGLGSDSDSVISGVEGVDDNLMYSGGSRSRRTAKDNNSERSDKQEAALLTDNEMKTSLENFNAPNYQENDAFGPLPQNYDGDLGRYKRIRRVKQAHNSQEIAPSAGG